MKTKEKKLKEEIMQDLIEALNEQFPKGKCKERGQALVFFAHIDMAVEEAIYRSRRK